jgi:hypothetical protein
MMATPFRTHSPGLRRILFLLLPVMALVLLFSASPAPAEEDLEMINRPVNTSGLTGLLFTTAPFTLPPQSTEIAVATISENSVAPDFTVTQLPIFSVTAGIAQNMELAIKSSYFSKNENNEMKQRGAGDTELSYKWNFLPQTESSPSPAIALIVTGIIPTGDRDLNLGVVAHWGAKCGLSIGREITWSDHVLGAYIDGQVVVHDLSDDRFRDRYSILNIGLLYPISKYRNLQIIIEYNLVSGIDKISDVGGDYTGVTYGLRMVSERFNLTIGAQFLRKDVQGFDNTSRVIGMASIKF